VLNSMTDGAITSRVEAIPRERLLDRLCVRQQQFKEIVADILGTVWLSRRTVSGIGGDIDHPVPLKMVLRRSGAQISWEIASAEPEDLTAAALLTVTNNRKFAFAVCRLPSCRRILARSVRGRPQKYCSAACKGRGVPSAKKRSNYVTAYRARRREQDLRRVAALLEHCKREDRYALLRRTFPGRPAKSILHVMRRAEKVLDATRRQRQAKLGKPKSNSQSSPTSRTPAGRTRSQKKER
jgi:hypothetical protein